MTLQEQQAPPANATIIANLPYQDLPDSGDHLLCIQQDGSLKQLLAASLASQGEKGDKGETGAQGDQGPAGKDASAQTGDIKAWLFKEIPEKWLKLEGQVFDKNIYPALFDLLGSQTLPDFRNRVLRGAGELIQLGEAQEDALQNITGTIPGIIIGDGATGAFNLLNYTSSYLDPAAIKGGWNDVRGAFYNFGLDISKSPSARTATETRVKSIGIQWIIFTGQPS